MTIDEIRKIGEQALIRYSRKFTVPLPDAFIEYNELESGDEMEVFREKINGRDALIIIPKKQVAERVPA